MWKIYIIKSNVWAHCLINAGQDFRFWLTKTGNSILYGWYKAWLVMYALRSSFELQAWSITAHENVLVTSLDALGTDESNWKLALSLMNQVISWISMDRLLVGSSPNTPLNRSKEYNKKDDIGLMHSVKWVCRWMLGVTESCPYSNSNQRQNLNSRAFVAVTGRKRTLCHSNNFWEKCQWILFTFQHQSSLSLSLLH